MQFVIDLSACTVLLGGHQKARLWRATWPLQLGLSCAHCHVGILMRASLCALVMRAWGTMALPACYVVLDNMVRWVSALLHAGAVWVDTGVP